MKLLFYETSFLDNTCYHSTYINQYLLGNKHGLYEVIGSTESLCHGMVSIHVSFR